MPRDLHHHHRSSVSTSSSTTNKRPPLLAKSAGCCLLQLDPHYSSSTSMYLDDEGTYVCKAFSPRSYVIQKVVIPTRPTSSCFAFFVIYLYVYVRLTVCGGVCGPAACHDIACHHRLRRFVVDQYVVVVVKSERRSKRKGGLVVGAGSFVATGSLVYSTVVTSSFHRPVCVSTMEKRGREIARERERERLGGTQRMYAAAWMASPFPSSIGRSDVINLRHPKD